MRRTQRRLLPPTGRLAVGLSATAVVVLISTVIVYVWPEGSHSTHQRRRLGGASAEELSPVRRSLEREFTLFDTPPERLSQPMKRAVGKGPMNGLNWGLAQRLRLRSISPIWAVPGENMICLFGLLRNRHGQPLYGATCTPDAQAESDGAFISYLNDASTGSPRPLRVIAGIAPAGVKAVIAHAGNHGVRIEVKRGVFARRDRGRQPPDRLSPVREDSRPR
jgi:hypothetical protein